MKQQNKQGLLILCPWILGFAAAFLRRALYIQATDIKGLLIRNHPLALILWALVGLAAAFVLLSVRKLGGSNGYEENFGKALPTGYLLLAAVIGITVLSGNTGRMGMGLRSLGFLCIPALIWGGIDRYRGKMPCFLVHAVLCLFFLLYAVSRYQFWSGNPQMQDYIFELLALLALAMFSYHCAAFETGSGDRRMQLAAGLLSILFCGATLGRTDTTAFYAAAMIWAGTDLCRLTPPPEEKETENHDPS